MNEVQDKLNNTVDGEFISEEKTHSIFGTTMARASVVQSLFESEVSKDYKSSNIEKLSFFKKSNKSKQKIAKKILSYALENKNSIDESIIKFTNDKSIERIPKTDLSILRMAISEISCGLETPVGVIVNAVSYTHLTLPTNSLV